MEDAPWIIICTFSPEKFGFGPPCFAKARQGSSLARRLLKSLGGVTQVNVNQGTGSIVIIYDRTVISFHAIINAMAAGGFVPAFYWKSPKLLAQPALRFSLSAEPMESELPQKQG